MIKDTDYQIVVLSTDWHELLVPFSEFVHATRYTCFGGKIHLGQNGLPQKIESITPLPKVPTRKLSPRHFIWEFQLKAAARAAIEVLAQHMKNCGLEDFILGLVKLRANLYGVSHLVYFAQQELSLDEYMALIRKRISAEALVEFEEWLDGFTELSDKIGEAADKVWDDEYSGGTSSYYERIKAKGAQISHPEKAGYWFQDSQTKEVVLFRYGRLNDPTISDKTLIAELVGREGLSMYTLDIEARIDSKAELDAIESAIDNVFFFNAAWRSTVRDLVTYAVGNRADAVRIKAFSNDDIFSSLAYLAVGQIRSVPTFSVEIDNIDSTEAFIGVIEWNGTNFNFDRLIEDYFSGDGFSYFMERHLGEHRSINADLMSDLGLSYCMVRKGDGGNLAKIRVQGNSIMETRSAQPRLLGEFLANNKHEVSGIVNLFLAHDFSFGRQIQESINEDITRAEATLEVKANVVNSTAVPTFWKGELDSCDLCQRPFESIRLMLDGRTKAGPWACMCATCALEQNATFKWGSGQLYSKTDDGWVLVAGGPPILE